MTYKQTLIARLDELRKRFIDTQDLVYQARFNEAKHLLELYELDQNRRAEDIEQRERWRINSQTND